MKTRLAPAFLAALFGLATVAHAVTTAPEPSPVADAIYINGAIWTADSARPAAKALAVRGDRLLAVGSNSAIRTLAGPATVVVDLRGRFVVPGFQDSHAHFPGPPLNRVDLAGADSIDEFQRRLSAFARAHPQETWIIGAGWGYSAFPDKVAHKRYLDSVIADRPVFVTERDGHMCLANSKALALAGVTRDTPDPEKGRIVRDTAGEPTGELLEGGAMRLVSRLLPQPTPDEIYQAFLTHLSSAAAAGITGVQNAHGKSSDHAVFVRAQDAGALKVRLRLAWRLPGVGTDPAAALDAKNLAEVVKLRENFQGPLLEFGALKGFVDGTVDARTAAMFEPLVGGANGTPFWSQDDLNRAIALYDRAGFQIMLHAIGDRAIHMALDAYEFAAKTNGTSGRRHRIEHAENPAPKDLARLKSLGVVVCTGPMYASPDPTTLESFAVLLGPERASRADAFKSYDDAGAVQAFGTDWPYFPLPPLLGIYTAVTRMTPAGTPPGGWYPSGRISVEAALRHYTIDGAYACFAEQQRGSLAPGKLADFVVLSENLLEILPSEILETKVLLTVLGGHPTYRADGW